MRVLEPSRSAAALGGRDTLRFVDVSSGTRLLVAGVLSSTSVRRSCAARLRRLPQTTKMSASVFVAAQPPIDVRFVIEPQMVLLRRSRQNADAAFAPSQTPQPFASRTSASNIFTSLATSVASGAKNAASTASTMGSAFRAFSLPAGVTAIAFARGSRG